MIRPNILIGLVLNDAPGAADVELSGLLMFELLKFNKTHAELKLSKSVRLDLLFCYFVGSFCYVTCSRFSCIPYAYSVLISCINKCFDDQ